MDDLLDSFVCKVLSSLPQEQVFSFSLPATCGNIWLELRGRKSTKLTQIVLLALREELVEEEILQGRVVYQLHKERLPCSLCVFESLELISVDERENVHAHLPEQVVCHVATSCVGSLEIGNELVLDVVLENLSDHLEVGHLDVANSEE